MRLFESGIVPSGDGFAGKDCFIYVYNSYLLLLKVLNFGYNILSPLFILLFFVKRIFLVINECRCFPFDYFLHLHSHLNTGKGSKKPAYKKAVETGTANDDVDYEWIPRSALRTPGSNKTSPRQRKGNRHAGSDTD